MLQHQDAVGDAERKRPAAAPFADDDRNDRDGEPRHLVEVPRDGLALTTLLRAYAGVCAGRVDERQHGEAELLRELHQPERLPVALRVRHPEVAPYLVLYYPALVVAYHHHGRALEPSHPAHYCRVVREGTVSVHLDEAGGEEADVVFDVRPVLVAGDLDPLPCVQV